MILKGSQRGGGGQLAAHLMNDIDNDHVALIELRGFLSSDLSGALAEAHAVSKGTRCKQFMFSLSLNPPKSADASIDSIVDAANRAEEKLGLAGQPRALVVHEKEGRRHAHVVWSRIDADSMTAINLPFFKSRLAALSKELYLEHGWELPDGHKQNGWKNPLNFTLAEWQQAKRLDLDPRELKQVFQQAWQQSDSGKSFQAALEDSGLYLAKGDRRGFVAVDLQGEVFSMSRMTGAKTKDLESRLGGPESFQSVEAVKDMINGLVGERSREHIRLARAELQARLEPLKEERAEMVEAQRAERQKLADGQETRRVEENKARQARLRGGFKGLLDLLTGRAAEVSRQNEGEAFACHLRDKEQREMLFGQHNAERQELQERLEQTRRDNRKQLRVAIRTAATLLSLGEREENREADTGYGGRRRDWRGLNL